MTRLGRAINCVAFTTLTAAILLVSSQKFALGPTFHLLQPQAVAADAVPAPLTAFEAVRRTDKVVVVPKLSSEDTEWVEQEVPEWHPAVYTVDDLSATLHTSVNKGHEALAYLRYIIDNYDNLPDTIAFIHSHKDGYPKAWHNDNIEYSNVVTLQRLNTTFVQAQGFVNLRCNGDPGCPAEVVLNRGVPDETRTTEFYMPAVWRTFFPDTPLPDIVGTACCAQIAVSRDQVLKRTLDDYRRYRQWLLDTELPDKVSGRIMEYLWHVIFGRDAVFCPPIDQCYCDLYGQC